MLESIEKNLVKKIEAAMAVPVKTDRFFSFNTFLLMVSRVYGLGVKIRTALYRTGVLRSKSLPCFVISIGNITVGGTGKTPMTLYVADFVKKLGYRVAVISRGYKGEFEKHGGVVSDGKRLFCSPAQSGDEPCMMATLLKVPVVVGKNRFRAAMTAVDRFKPHVVILDDAFQHLAVHRDLNLLLVDSSAPFGNRALLPRGPLREPVSAVKRSDALILTRCSNGDLGTLVGRPTFKTDHTPFVYQVIDSSGRVMDTKAAKDFLSNGRKRSGFLFSGIAKNCDFRKGCEKLGIRIAGFLEFSDHFWYTGSDLEAITLGFKNAGADCIVTTQKDWVKLLDFAFFSAPIVVVGVAVVFEKGSGNNFKTLIKSRLERSV